MAQTYQSITIGAPVEKVWDRIRNFHDMGWVPNVITSLDIEGGKKGNEAGATLERLRSVLADTFASVAVPVTVSVGAVSHLKAPDDLERMVQRADACMYKAKSTGKNRLRLEVVGRDGGPERLREREEAGD